MIKKGHTGKYINLPDNIQCRIQYDLFKICKISVLKNHIYNQDYEYDLIISGDTLIKEAGMVIHTRILENINLRIEQKHFVKYFDYDKIKGALKVRNRRDGDYIYPSGMSGKKKLKDYFIDKKVPREERDTKALLVLGSEVLWIPNLRDTKNYKIDENTENIIEITIERGA
jgi:tRNA(Ile)-lysidine synthase